MTKDISKSHLTTDTKILPKLDHKQVRKRNGRNRVIGDFNAFRKLEHKSEHYRKDLPNIKVENQKLQPIEAKKINGFNKIDVTSEMGNMGIGLEHKALHKKILT